MLVGSLAEKNDKVYVPCPSPERSRSGLGVFRLPLLTKPGEQLRSRAGGWPARSGSSLSLLWREEVTEVCRKSPQGSAFLRLVWLWYEENNFQRKIPLKHPADVTLLQQTQISWLVFGDILFPAPKFWILIQNEHLWWNIGSLLIVQFRDCMPRRAPLACPGMSRKLQHSGSRAACRAMAMPPEASFYCGMQKKSSSLWAAWAFWSLIGILY